MTFLADENVDQPIVAGLRAAGHTVLAVVEMASSISDDVVLEMANRQGMVLLTGDKDFGELIYRDHHYTFGIVLIRLAGLTAKAKADLEKIEKLGLDKLPVCMAKTQNSLSDNPKLLGRPENFLITIREIEVAAGAGFVIPITGEIMRMPGLPTFPAAENVDVDDNGKITGLF